MNTETPSPMMSPDDGAVLTQRGGVGGGGAAAMLPPAERAAAFMASPRNSLSRGMRPPGAVGGGVAGGGRWWQEFNAMDENMTEHLVNVQQQALQLAMVVQRIEDGQNSAAGQSGESSTAFMGRAS